MAKVPMTTVPLRRNFTIDQEAVQVGLDATEDCRPQNGSISDRPKHGAPRRALCRLSFVAIARPTHQFNQPVA